MLSPPKLAPTLPIYRACGIRTSPESVKGGKGSFVCGFLFQVAPLQPKWAQESREPERGPGHAPPTTYLQLEPAQRDTKALLSGWEVGDLHFSDLVVRVVQDQRQRPRVSQAHISEAEERRPAEVAERQDRRGSCGILGRVAPQPRRRPPLGGAHLPASPHTPGRHGSFETPPGDSGAAPTRLLRSGDPGRGRSEAAVEVVQRIRPPFVSSRRHARKKRSKRHKFANSKGEQNKCGPNFGLNFSPPPMGAPGHRPLPHKPNQCAAASGQ